MCPGSATNVNFSRRWDFLEFSPFRICFGSSEKKAAIADMGTRDIMTVKRGNMGSLMSIVKEINCNDSKSDRDATFV